MRHYGVFAFSIPVLGIVHNELNRFGTWILANRLCGTKLLLKPLVQTMRPETSRVAIDPHTECGNNNLRASLRLYEHIDRVRTCDSSSVSRVILIWWSLSLESNQFKLCATVDHVTMSFLGRSGSSYEATLFNYMTD